MTYILHLVFVLAQRVVASLVSLFDIQKIQFIVARIVAGTFWDPFVTNKIFNEVLLIMTQK